MMHREVFIIVSVVLSAVLCDKYRICVVDGKGGFKKASTYCPILDRGDSKVECVIGVDRLDCLRRISKGRADFSIFTPEDLVTAINSEIEVLITNEMRFTKKNNEYQVVAVINDDSGIKSKHDLRDKRLCHPGYGYETDWTNILANYLEASVVPQSCTSSLSLTENRIKSSSEFFKAACKAGPWVNDKILDQQLKRKYKNLCALCYSPGACSRQDKYWGRRGPLFCLSDGEGDIAWVRLDDVRAHFGITPGTAVSSPVGYSYLCRDGTTMPVNGTSDPCVWVVKPWPVIAAERKKATEIQTLLASLNRANASTEWEPALLRLMETFPVDLTPVRPIAAIDTHLNEALGFLAANSFPGCHPPRTIRICTSTNHALAKCGWMREAAAVYGIEPDLDCIRAMNVTQCMQALGEDDAADLVVIEPDDRHVAQMKYNLEALFFEAVVDEHKYRTIVIAKASSTYRSLSDLRGLRACFPRYDGIAYNTVLRHLQADGLISACPLTHNNNKINLTHLDEFFTGGVCASGSNSSMCKDDRYDGEYGTLRCLQNMGDVAFLAQKSFDQYFTDPKERIGNATVNDYRVLCPTGGTQCHLSWSPIGMAMVPRSKTELWKKDTVDVFLQLDNLFGKQYQSLTTPFTLFGLFDSTPNVIFHDATAKLKTVPYYRHSDYLDMEKEYGSLLGESITCNKMISSSSSSLVISESFNIVFVITVIWYYCL